MHEDDDLTPSKTPTNVLAGSSGCAIACSPAASPRPARAGYSVVTVPHHNVRKGTVEIYKDLVSALQRHASIAAQLRADGWSIASYTTT